MTQESEHPSPIRSAGNSRSPLITWSEAAAGMAEALNYVILAQRRYITSISAKRTSVDYVFLVRPKFAKVLAIAQKVMKLRTIADNEHISWCRVE